jgi:RHS repeat-associated protein
VTYLVNSAEARAAEYRFSSKEWFQSLGLYYYGYRFYDPNLQRWLNRDPIGEIGFNVLTSESSPFDRDYERNLYAFVGNSPLNYIDELGLAYGNPVSGPSGPVGPWDPWVPGGAYWVPPLPPPCSGFEHFINPHHCPFYRLDMARRCASNWKEWGYRSYWDCVTASFVCHGNNSPAAAK